MQRLTAVCLCLLALLTVSAAFAADKAAPAVKPAPLPKERSVVTHHSVVVGGKRIGYTATAGTLVLRNAKDQPEASVFYIAYTRDGVKNPAERPLTFAYNGGPGASSNWVNIGGFGPRRVQIPNAKFAPPPPYRLVNNQYSLLNKTDLVFIDAVGTGYSITLGKTPAKHFWGVDQDVKSFGAFIQRYLTKYDRWNSPLFLLGESYGTFRSVALANYLEQQGDNLNGVILLSSILNFAETGPEDGFVPRYSNDLRYELTLPSYAAVACYHQVTRCPADLESYLRQVRAFAIGPYAAALAQGDALSASERNAVAARLHAYTGLSERYLIESNLRVSLSRFLKALLHGKGKEIGRFDARYDEPDLDLVGASARQDASANAVSAAFNAGFRYYLEHDLDYRTRRHYVGLNMTANSHWDWAHVVNGQKYVVADAVPDLRDALVMNPHLLIFSANGLYDLATPFFRTEYDISHANLPAGLQHNITFGYYPAGHMLYLNPKALAKLHHDLDAFYGRATRR